MTYCLEVGQETSNNEWRHLKRILSLKFLLWLTRLAQIAQVFTFISRTPGKKTDGIPLKAIALSTNSNEASIYARDGYEWQPISTLAQHDKLVTSIDWAPTTDRIVTCAQDRNAYVWTKEADPSNPSQIVWKPTLVVLKINRAATQVRWSPLENKFAVASGA
ncbi:hypothetical protein FRC20_010335, partial [Serendipita sp. 405]